MDGDLVSRQKLIDLIDRRLAKECDNYNYFSEDFINGMKDGYYRLRSDVCSFPAEKSEPMINDWRKENEGSDRQTISY